MRDFAYTAAARIEDAFAAGAMPIAGGTELLNWFRLGIAETDAVVDILPVAELGRIEANEGVLAIGALATLGTIGGDQRVQAHATALSQACLLAASPQIRNRATVGGNILQKTRCAYFRAEAPLPWGCNKRVPGSGCAALEGFNDRHAIFGWTPGCVAVHPADPPVALAALDAEVVILGANGSRTMPVDTLLLTQQDASSEGLDPARAENRLVSGEIITGYRIPIRPGARSAYVKVRERASYEYALVSAAAVIDLEDGLISRAAIALGSVAQKPWRLPEAEKRLLGLTPTRDAVLPILREATAEARPLAHNGYKLKMAAGAAARAIVEAAAMETAA